MTLRPLTFAIALTCTAIAAAAPPPVTLAMSPAGELTVRLGDRPVATGVWHLRQDNYLLADGPHPVDAGADALVHGTPGGTPTHVASHETHAGSGAVVDYAFDVEGEDLTVTAHVANPAADRTLKPVAFTGLTVHLNPAADRAGHMPAWFWTYLQANGLRLYHPAIQNPLGVWWVGDDRFAVAVHSESEFDRPAMACGVWTDHDDYVPPEFTVEFHTARPVPPGHSVDVTVTFRITPDRSLPHLLGGYKAAMDRHYPLPLYTPDRRLMIQNAAVDKAAQSRSNPYGFQGDVRRLDTAFGTAQYVHAMVPAARSLGAGGVIFWAPGGMRPVMYPPDFDVFPPAVERNLPRLMSAFHEQGLRVGLCARPGEGVRYPPDGRPPDVYRLSADDPAQMRELIGRFDHVRRLGFDAFYLDTFGATGLNDIAILRQVRAAVGPDVPLYTEDCCDLSLRWADHYCEYLPDGTVRNAGGPVYAGLRTVCPSAVWLCMSRQNGDPVPAAYSRLGLTPLVVDDAVLNGRLRRGPAVPPGH